MKYAACLSGLLLLGGCATVYTQSSSPYDDALKTCPIDYTIPNIYSGTVFDLHCIPAENAGFFCLVDLPLSLVLDTVLLPLTIYRQIDKGPWYHPAECAALNPQPGSPPE